MYMVSHRVQLLWNLKQKNKPEMYQQTASTIPKYHSARNIHSAVVESVICGQMKKLTQVTAVFWLRTGQQLCISLTTVTSVQISTLLEERLRKDRALRNLLIHRHHNSA